MCRLVEHIDDKQFIGYKAVAKKNGKYYSLAIGFQYRQPSMTLGKRTKQKRIHSTFGVDILVQGAGGGWEENMVGRTAAFYTLDQLTWHLFRENGYGKLQNGYEMVYVRVKLTNDLMSGTYGAPVVAGKTIQILEEVQE